MDFYQTLGVSYLATGDDIKKAFRELSKKYHPDVYPDASDDEKQKLQEKFSKISIAYTTLSDSKKKKTYDLLNGIIEKRVKEEQKRKSEEKEEVVEEPVIKEDIIIEEENTNNDQTITVNYDYIKKYLDINYNKILINDVLIYLDNGKTVAAIKDDIITLYFKCSRDQIWTHNNRVMVGIAKNIPILSNYKGYIADVAMFRGMCGTSNIFEKKHGYNYINDDDIYYDYFIDNRFCHKIKDNDLGYVGTVNDNGFIIGDDEISISFKSYHGFERSEDISFGVLETKNPIDADKEVFAKEWNAIREENDWYWTNGYNTTGSNVTRAKINYLKDGNNYHHICNASIKAKANIFDNTLLEDREIKGL